MSALNEAIFATNLAYVPPPAMGAVLHRATARVEELADGLDVPDLETFDKAQAIEELLQGIATRRQIKRLAAGGLQTIEEHTNSNEILNTLLSAVDSLGRSLLKALLMGYLIAGRNESYVTRNVREFLLNRVDRLPKQWQKRVNAFSLLSVNVGEICTDYILNTEHFEIFSFEKTSGLKGVKANGGVGKAVFKALVRQVSVDQSEHNLDRFFDYCTANNSLRFKTMISDYATALLSPFVNGRGCDLYRDRIEKFLIDHFGDPRLNPGAWSNVESSLLSVIKGWLASASLELLLSIVSQTNDSHQWEERSEFWEHYFEEGTVTDAWVALGPRAAQVARSLVARGELESNSAYAELRGGGVEPDHSMLMFKLNGFTVTEWTHLGKVRIYDERNADAPKFYARNYGTSSIRRDSKANVALTHDAHGRWLEKVSAFIKFETGILPPKYIRESQTKKRCRKCENHLPEAWYRKKDANVCTRCELKDTYV